MKNNPCSYLLNQIFDVSKKTKGYTWSSDEINRILHSKACFNGAMGSGKNLEAYLKLIVDSQIPDKADQYQFYLNWKDRLLKEGIKNDIDDPFFNASELQATNDPFDNEIFNYNAGIQNRKQALRMLINSSHKVSSKEIANSIILYLLKSLPLYPAIGDEQDLNLRHSMIYYITRLLNDVGWHDEEGKHFNNSNESVGKIADWIFGRKKYNKVGILSILGEESRGILGFYDLMVFRLTCNANRGGDIFNITRALSLDDNPKNPTDGNVDLISIAGMRIISQKVYAMFRTQYIAKKVNIFKVVNELSFANLTGSYENYFSVNLDDTGKEKMIQNCKRHIISFIIFQLCNWSVKSGVGCGFYDVTGNKDGKEINKKINSYLFDLCFNPSEGENNLMYFIDFMMFNCLTSSISSSDGEKIYFQMGNIFQDDGIDRKMLTDFWSKNKKKIQNIGRKNKDKIIYVGSQKLTYDKYLKQLYALIDDITGFSTR